MREILFKAKRIDNGKWVEGYVIRRHGLYFLYDIINSESYRQNICEVDPETLCQFTGLCDKNGKKIWEKDILMAHLDESYPEDVTYETVEWNFAGWVGNETDSTDRKYLDEFDLEYFEVVGNIFDNPELLQEESDE